MPGFSNQDSHPQQLLHLQPAPKAASSSAFFRGCGRKGKSSTLPQQQQCQGPKHRFSSLWKYGTKHPAPPKTPFQERVEQEKLIKKNMYSIFPKIKFMCLNSHWSCRSGDLYSVPSPLLARMQLQAEPLHADLIMIMIFWCSWRVGFVQLFLGLIPTPALHMSHVLEQGTDDGLTQHWLIQEGTNEPGSKTRTQ